MMQDKNIIISVYYGSPPSNTISVYEVLNMHKTKDKRKINTRSFFCNGRVLHIGVDSSIIVESPKQMSCRIPTFLQMNTDRD